MTDTDTMTTRLRDCLPTDLYNRLGISRHSDGSVTIRHEWLMQALDYAMERGWHHPDPAGIVALSKDVTFDENDVLRLCRPLATYHAFCHEEWESAGLADFDTFAEYATFINERPDGFEQSAGEWFFAPDEPLSDGRFVIYIGDYSSDWSPFASTATYAEVYSPLQEVEYRERVKELEAMPEFDEDAYLDEDGDDDIEDGDDLGDDDTN